MTDKYYIIEHNQRLAVLEVARPLCFTGPSYKHWDKMLFRLSLNKSADAQACHEPIDHWRARWPKWPSGLGSRLPRQKGLPFKRTNL